VIEEWEALDDDEMRILCESRHDHIDMIVCKGMGIGFIMSPSGIL